MQREVGWPCRCCCTQSHTGGLKHTHEKAHTSGYYDRGHEHVDALEGLYTLRLAVSEI